MSRDIWEIVQMYALLIVWICLLLIIVGLCSFAYYRYLRLEIKFDRMYLDACKEGLTQYCEKVK